MDKIPYGLVPFASEVYFEILRCFETETNMTVCIQIMSTK